MIYSFFAGDILRPEDVPSLIFIIAIYAIPSILFVITLIMLIRDAFKRKFRRRTLIFMVLTVIGLLINTIITSSY